LIRPTQAGARFGRALRFQLFGQNLDVPRWIVRAGEQSTLDAIDQSGFVYLRRMEVPEGIDAKTQDLEEMDRNDLKVVDRFQLVVFLHPSYPF